MHYAANSHPAWGYLAPAPSLLRTARVVLVAAAVGATTGAGVVISLLDRPAAGKSSVAARTLARPVQTSLAAPDLHAARAGAQSGVTSQPTDAAVSEARHSSTIEARAAILAESATAINEPTAKSAAAAPFGNHAPPLAASALTTPAPVQDKVVGKKPRFAYRYAPPGELVDRVRSGQYMTGGWTDHSTNTSKRDGYGPRGPSYREAYRDERWTGSEREAYGRRALGSRPYRDAYRDGRREGAYKDGGRDYRDRW